MADNGDNNGNTLLLTDSSSGNFLKQRKIAYVDNPFDEQASTSMQKCDLKYFNFPRYGQRPTRRQSKKNEEILCPPTSQVREFFESKEKDERVVESAEDVWALTFRRESSNPDWSCLFSPVQCHDNSPSGELQLSLSYDPWLATLKVAVIKARGLTCSMCARKAKNSGIICVGTFITVSLLCKNKRVQTKQTEMKTKKAEIFFYDKFSFLVQKDDVKECCLQCRAVHKVGSIFKRDHVIGQVLIGGEGYCDGDGLRHWSSMLRKPKKNITEWHYIKQN